ncbi:hypothetical protein EJ04DRAFT_493232 [Polyplosphaeria fusca]|uniref:DUF6594 domain-containing protein n=1 Tax=Polyplosphaeria fusca TaxID=682080 RepID=A0A9P4V2V3_9PLEO|nr:hypothetical protein EJ04DRAFT_493232 [Polyplosphaeria fusca]
MDHIAHATQLAEKNNSIGAPGSGDAIINIQFNDTDSRAPTAVNTLSNSTIKSESEQINSKKNADDEVNKTDTRPLEDYHRGYPKQAAFQSSESGFSIYRGFSYLHSRVILELQDELRYLEDNLSYLDRHDFNNGRHKCLMSREYDLRQAKRDNISSKRATLISQIRDKLVNYDEVLLKARELNSFQRPSSRDYRSVRRWFFREKPLSYAREEEFIKRKEDLISLRQGREWALFDGYVENIIRFFHCKFVQRIFATPELRAKTKDDCIHYYSSSRIEKLVDIIITLVIFVLLIIPVVLMYNLTSVGKHHRIFDAVGVLVVFTLVFSAAMSCLTKAKRHELFAASAAYCAVLVVFISNFGGPNGSPPV